MMFFFDDLGLFFLSTLAILLYYGMPLMTIMLLAWFLGYKRGFTFVFNGEVKVGDTIVTRGGVIGDVVEILSTNSIVIKSHDSLLLIERSYIAAKKR